MNLSKMDNKESFQHSTKVPQIYKTSAKILKKVQNKEGRLQTLIFNDNLSKRIVSI